MEHVNNNGINSLEFFHGYNPDRYIQLYNVISFWCTNLSAWFMTTFYVYDWFKTVFCDEENLKIAISVRDN